MSAVARKPFHPGNGPKINKVHTNVHNIDITEEKTTWP